MPDHASGLDLKTLWRDGSESMPLRPGPHVLRQKAKDLEAKTRREFTNGIVVALLLAGAAAYGSYWTDSPVARAAFAITSVWALAGQYFLHRTKREAPLPHDAGRRTSLDSCRRQLEHHLRFDRCTVVWLQGPLLLGFGTLIGALAGRVLFTQMTPVFIALLAAWVPSMIAFRQIQERRIRRALRELDELEHGTAIRIPS